MSSSDATFDEAIVAQFLMLFAADRRQGATRSRAEYLVLFPGHERVVADRFDRILTETERDDDVPVAGTRFGNIGPYALREMIGRGGQGTVYLADDTRLGRRVAIKVLQTLGPAPPETLERFRREAELASRLDHPGICTVYEGGTAEGVPFIAMQYVDGETLARRLARVGSPVSRTETLEVIRTIEVVARALHVAHEAGVVHRDVKPANIMIGSEGDPVVLDFGLARIESGPGLTATGDVFGTPAYMAPEQLRPGRTGVDPRTDVYALGVTLFELLTGTTPFAGTTRAALFDAILTREPDPVTRLNPAVSKDLAIVVATAMTKEADGRYQSAGLLADDLRAVREGRPVAARPIGVVGRVARWARREPLRATVLALALVIPPTAAGIAAYALPRLWELEQKERTDEYRRLIAEASSAFSGGRIDEAEGLYLAAGRLVPDSTEVFAGRVLCRRRRGDVEGAVALMEANPEQLERRPSLRRWLADSLRRVGRDDDAAQVATDVPDPRDALDHFLIGIWGVEGGAPQDPTTAKRALHHLDLAVMLAPESRLEFVAARCVAAGRAGDVETLQDCMSVLERRWPDSSATMERMGFGLIELNRFEDAVSWFRRLAAARSGDPWARINLVIALRLAGRVGEAMAVVDGLIEEDAGCARAHSERAWLLKTHDLDAAITTVRLALTLDPRSGLFHDQLGGMLREKGLHTAAVEEFRKAVQFAPSTAESWANLAQTCCFIGRYQEALVASQRVIDLAPLMVYGPSRRGEALRGLGRLEPALQSVEEAIRLDPTNVHARILKLQCLTDLKRPVAAKRAYQELMGLDPSTNVTLTVTQFRGQLSRRDRLDRVLLSGELPEDAKTLARLATTATEAGRWVLAHDLWTRAFDDDPEIVSETRSPFALSAARTALRRADSGAARACEWLSTAAAAWREGLEADDLDSRRILRALRRWVTHPDLADFRRPEQLGGEDAAAWRRLWQDVDALIAMCK